MVAYVYTCMVAYICIYTFTQYIFIYIYKTEYGVQKDRERERGIKRSRTCCVKCRCCSLKKKKKKYRNPTLLLNREWRDFGTQISGDYEIQLIHSHMQS